MRCQICGTECDWTCGDCGGGNVCHYDVESEGSCAFFQNQQTIRLQQELARQQLERKMRQQAEQREKAQKLQEAQDKKDSHVAIIKSCQSEQLALHQQENQLKSYLSQLERDSAGQKEALDQLRSDFDLKQTALFESQTQYENIIREQLLVDDKLQSLTNAFREEEESEFLRRGTSMQLDHNDHGQEGWFDKVVEFAAEEFTSHAVEKALTKVLPHAVASATGQVVGWVMFPEMLGDGPDPSIEMLKQKKMLDSPTPSIIDPTLFGYLHTPLSDQVAQDSMAQGLSLKDGGYQLTRDLKAEIKDLYRQKEALDQELLERKSKITAMSLECEYLTGGIKEREMHLQFCEQEMKRKQEETMACFDKEKKLQDKLKRESQQLEGVEQIIRGFGR